MYIRSWVSRGFKTWQGLNRPGTGFRVSQKLIQIDCECHLVPFPTSFKPSQKGIFTPWLAERGTPKAASTHPSGVGLHPAHSGSEPTAVSPERFWKSAKDKKRKPVLNNGTATKKQTLCLIDLMRVRWHWNPTKPSWAQCPD